MLHRCPRRRSLLYNSEGGEPDSVRTRLLSLMHFSAKSLTASAALLSSLSITMWGGAFAQVPQQYPPPLGPEPTTNTRPVFEFHSGFWANLHLVLYEQARLRAERPVSNGGGESEAATAATAARPERGDSASRDWNAAVEYYQHEFSNRDLLVDGSMVAIYDRLGELEGCADLSGRGKPACASGLRPEMIAILEGAAPIYRSHGWEQDDKVNRDWIASVAPLVRQMGGTLAEQLAAVYHGDWPRKPMRVDVVSYGGLFGSYTTLDPTHITISSTDPRNQSYAGFEVLFHEASHALASAVFHGIAKECRARDIPIPRDLWHALLFYTTGQLVKQMLEQKKLAASYTPYAYRYGLFDRGWQNYQHVLEASWQPYLDGKVSFDRALAQVVEGL